MEKDFDRWNKEKKHLDTAQKDVDFHEREIWWCSIGVNIGSEQHSQTNDFSRPILVVRRFTPDMFWGIPLTTKLREGGFRYRFVFDGVESEALLLQMRAYDRKRLVRKVGMMPKEFFVHVIREIKGLL